MWTAVVTLQMKCELHTPINVWRFDRVNCSIDCGEMLLSVTFDWWLLSHVSSLEWMYEKDWVQIPGILLPQSVAFSVSPDLFRSQLSSVVTGCWKLSPTAIFMSSFKYGLEEKQQSFITPVYFWQWFWRLYWLSRIDVQCTWRSL